MTTLGRRIYPNDKGEMWFAPGDYGKDPRDGVWRARPPAPDGDAEHRIPMTGSLENHTVIEHEDDTITVSPSILISAHDVLGAMEWHGYLERGTWRTA